MSRRPRIAALGGGTGLAALLPGAAEAAVFASAVFVLNATPGVDFLLTVSRTLQGGARAGVAAALGISSGCVVHALAAAFGLAALLALHPQAFLVIQWAGAAYLVWLGIRLIRSPVEGLDTEAPPPPPRGGFFLQGFLVLLSNPKVLVFFGAFIPQFMDMEKEHISQVALLGATFMVTGAITDTIYAVLAGRARRFFSGERTRLLSRISGGFMIGGGIWLALTRAR